MGGHGAHRNHNNMQETDEEMLGKIQRIDTIKHNPNHWHMDFNFGNMYTIFGGANTMVFAGLGAFIAVSYFRNAVAHQPYNFYAYNLRLFGRFFMGSMFGMAVGYQQFGDRQRLHNAYVAERLRRRYPESMSLDAKDLWQLKGVKHPAEYYRWT